MSSRPRWAHRALVGGLFGILALGAAPVAAQSAGYSVSFYGVRGSSPVERVDGVYIFNGIDFRAGPARLAISVPWMRVVTTPRDPVTGTDSSALPANTGVGDPLIRMDVRVVDDRARGLQVGVAGAVKVPAVDASTGRGTGKADAAIGATAFKTARRTSLMADILFWKYGDPEGADFSDTWSYSVGAARLVGNGRWSALASLAGFTAGVGDGPPPLALNLGVMTLVGRHQSLAVTASVGLNESATDFSVGTSWRIAR